MIRALFTLIVFAVATTCCGIPAILIHLVRRESDAVMRAARIWSAVLLRAVGAETTYEGLDHMRAHSPCIFIVNHQSAADIWALMNILPLCTRFVAKSELRRMPIVGTALTVSGFVFIDRRNRNRAFESLSQAAERISGGRSVLLFAEGTRSRDGVLQPFKKGPFHLALQAGVPIVPVAISGSWQVLRPGSIRPCPGPIRVRFLPPIDVSTLGAVSPDRLSALVREAIAAALDPPAARSDAAASAGARGR